MRDRGRDDDLGARLRAVAAWGDPTELPELSDLRPWREEIAPPRPGRGRRWWAPALAAAAAAAVVVGAVLASPTDDDVDVAGGPDFVAAIEASGVLASPSADEVERAMDAELYAPGSGQTQVSATGSYVSLRTCTFGLELRPGRSACPAGWAFVAGAVDGGEVHAGVLGAADHVDLSVIDGRFFVATALPVDADAEPTAWLIDAASGEVGELRWQEAPTTVRSPAQALVVCDESYDRRCFGERGPDAADGGHQYHATDVGLPRVLDARDGTIRPLAVPDDVEPGLPVAQRGAGRIWVGTEPAEDQLGLAFSDDGGASWTAVSLPEAVQATGDELARDLVYGDTLLEIAADGDRVAVMRSWAMPEDRQVPRGQLHVSDDGGRHWVVRPDAEPAGNGAHLYPGPDGRLVLLWSVDSFPTQLHASAGSDWGALERVEAPGVSPETDFSSERDFHVNRAGIAFSYSVVDPCDADGATCPEDPDRRPAPEITLRFSTDLTTWRTLDAAGG